MKGEHSPGCRQEQAAHARQGCFLPRTRCVCGKQLSGCSGAARRTDGLTRHKLPRAAGRCKQRHSNAFANAHVASGDPCAGGRAPPGSWDRDQPYPHRGRSSDVQGRDGLLTATRKPRCGWGLEWEGRSAPPPCLPPRSAAGALFAL